MQQHKLVRAAKHRFAVSKCEPRARRLTDGFLLSVSHPLPSVTSDLTQVKEADENRTDHPVLITMNQFSEGKAHLVSKASGHHHYFN